MRSRVTSAAPVLSNATRRGTSIHLMVRTGFRYFGMGRQSHVEAGDGLSGWAPDAMTVEEQAAQGTR